MTLTARVEAAVSSLEQSALDYTAAEAISVTGQNRAVSKQWAEEAENVEVEAGQYSAKHWALKVQAVADTVITALGDIDAALDTINGEVI